MCYQHITLYHHWFILWCACGLTVDAQYYRTSDRQEFEREISIEEYSRHYVVEVANLEAYVSFL